MACAGGLLAWTGTVRGVAVVWSTMTANDGGETIAPDVLVLPAFDADDYVVESGAFDGDAVPHELERWVEAYDVERAVSVPGANAPVLVAAEGDVAVTTTGMGKSAAAATVTACCACPRLDLSETTILSVGVAGASPARGTLGSVFVADAVVDWDVKHRWSERDAADEERPLALLRYRPEDYVHRLDDDLVSRALDVARGVDLADDPGLDAYRERYPHAAALGDPEVRVGTTLTGDEFWHGETTAAYADWLCDAYDAGPYCTTQMEDYATATALARFGHLDRYLSVRAVVNFDRPAPGQSVRASLDEETGGFALSVALENAFRVGRAIAADVREGAE
jgi:purine nucleoside permease